MQGDYMGSGEENRNCVVLRTRELLKVSYLGMATYSQGCHRWGLCCWLPRLVLSLPQVPSVKFGVHTVYTKGCKQGTRQVLNTAEWEGGHVPALGGGDAPAATC